MGNLDKWYQWQKQVIREEYKDITLARINSEKQVMNTVKESLPKVKAYVRN